MRLANLARVPFVNLFLILTFVIACSLGTTPTGLPIDIANKGNQCGDERLVIVNVVNGDRVELNLGSSLRRSELGSYLQEIFRTRAERLLFLQAAPDVSFREVAQVIDISRRYTERVAIVTPSVEKQTGGCLTIVGKSFVDYNRSKPLLEMKEVPLWRLFRPW
jgi:biopolymer transport protein TolR